MYNKLIGPWNHVVAAIPKLYSSADLQPADVNSALGVADPQSDPEAVQFELRPVVFKVPESIRKASGQLFVVVRGRFAFRRDAFENDQELVTQNFATEVGYFARRRDNLAHIFGIHYDFTPNQLGHPAFHAQLKSFIGFATWVKDRYGFEGEPTDEVTRILRTVRVPSAQMDVFSVFLQVCADHLVHANSSIEERAAFDTLLEHASFCAGAAGQVVRLTTTEAAHCYRSRRWYPSGL